MVPFALLMGLLLPMATFFNIQSITVPGWIYAAIRTRNHAAGAVAFAVFSWISVGFGVLGTGALFVRMLEKKIKWTTRLMLLGAFCQGLLSTILFIVLVTWTLTTDTPASPSTYYFEGLVFCLLAAVTSLAVSAMGFYQLHLNRGQLYEWTLYQLSPSQRQVTLLLIATVSYIVVGGVLYGAVEGWDFDDATYWSVVTFTTIGFGDLVPRTVVGKLMLPPFASIGIVLVAFNIYAIREVVLELVTLQLAEYFTKHFNTTGVSTSADDSRSGKVSPLDAASPHLLPTPSPRLTRHPTVHPTGGTGTSSGGRSPRPRSASIDATSSSASGPDEVSDHLTYPSRGLPPPHPPMTAEPVAFAPTGGAHAHLAPHLKPRPVSSSFAENMGERAAARESRVGFVGTGGADDDDGMMLGAPALRPISASYDEISEGTPLLIHDEGTGRGAARRKDAATRRRVLRASTTSAMMMDTPDIAGRSGVPRTLVLSRGAKFPNLTITGDLRRQHVLDVTQETFKRGIVNGLAVVVANTVVFGSLFAYFEKWNFLEGLYFTYVSLLSIGYGDYVPRTVQSRSIFIWFIFIGVASITYVGSLLAERALNQWTLTVKLIERRVDRYERKARIKKQYRKDVETAVATANAKHRRRSAASASGEMGLGASASEDSLRKGKEAMLGVEEAGNGADMGASPMAGTSTESEEEEEVERVYVFEKSKDAEVRLGLAIQGVEEAKKDAGPGVAKMVKLLSIVAAALVALPSVLALPTGAPRCLINKAGISGVHTRVADLGYTITVTPDTYTPGGEPIKITITGGPADFQGILTYATPGDASDADLDADKKILTHVGAFVLPEGLRAQTVESCTAAKVQNEAPESTITHSAPFASGKAPKELMWKPPAKDAGVVTINMAISTGSPSSGQMTFVKPITIKSAGGGAGPVNNAPAGNNTGVVSQNPTSIPKRYQCRLKGSKGMSNWGGSVPSAPSSSGYGAKY
ncbi:Potassium channel [Phlyctochytrium bullatum]|nr:Potassium channel [Phlyctochytrium bullatum]